MMFSVRSTLVTGILLFITDPAARAQVDRFPYPHNHTYTHGIAPSNFTQTHKNADLEAMWKAWRKAYLTDEGAALGELRVSKNKAKGESISEGIGYGMLISVYMANPRNTGKAHFDSLYHYYKRHEKIMDGTHYGLMAWRVGPMNKILGNYVAPDGDIDAAFSIIHHFPGRDGVRLHDEFLSHRELLPAVRESQRRRPLEPGDRVILQDV